PPTLGLELVGERGHDRRARLHRDQDVPAVPVERGAAREVARVAEQRDDDREVERLALDRANDPTARPGQDVLEVEGEQQTRHHQQRDLHQRSSPCWLADWAELDGCSAWKSAIAWATPASTAACTASGLASAASMCSCIRNCRGHFATSFEHETV